jgi:hypothetical protein
MDAKRGDAVAHRLHVTEQTAFEPLDPSDHDATNRGVCQIVSQAVNSGSALTVSTAAM